MSRTATLSFAALALFLVIFPLTLTKPGLPMTLKSDEPAYYLMALSLAYDHDLRCEDRDAQRLAIEFPYNSARNLILASDDGWKTAYFGKPYLVSLIVAPAVALFGANGFIATNMALLLLSVWLGALYLRQYNSDAMALLFSTGFFLLSNAFAYVFWLHTEVLCVASVTGCLYFAFTEGSDAPLRGRLGGLWRKLWNPATRPALSGAVLMAAAYMKPILALAGLAAFVVALRRRGVRGGATWLAGAVLAGALICAGSLALIGHWTPYLGIERQGIDLESFDAMPKLEPPPPIERGIGQRNSWAWIFTEFIGVDKHILENSGYFLVGRHTGLFVYAPFTLLSLLLFFAFSRRSLERWLLLASLAAIALAFMTLIWFNWHGGGGFIGNRYFVNVLPGLLFLVTRIAPDWLPLVGYAIAGLFVGSIVFTPFGANVPEPTLQAHVRNAPFALLPYERTLSAQIPGYRALPGSHGTWFFGRDDQFRVINDSIFAVGGQTVRLGVRAEHPMIRPVFEVSTFIAPNTVRIELSGSSESLMIDSARPPRNATRFELHPRQSRKQTVDGYNFYWPYDLTLRIDKQIWRKEIVRFRESKKGRFGKTPQPNGVVEPDWADNEVNLLVGATVTYLGEADDLEKDVYSIDWSGLTIPAQMPARRIVTFRGRVRNTSAAEWEAIGATAVDIGYRWLDSKGAEVPVDNGRITFARAVPAGATAAIVLELTTPTEPGTYTLVFDAVRERIAWFSERRPGQELRRSVEIVPASAASAASAASKH
jgi:hypothetical protein